MTTASSPNEIDERDPSPEEPAGGGSSAVSDDPGAPGTPGEVAADDAGHAHSHAHGHAHDHHHHHDHDYGGEDGDGQDLEDGDFEDGDFEDEDLEDEEDESLGTRSTVETTGTCKVKIHAEVPAEKVTELLDRNYRDMIQTLRLPGFRPGRVPRALVEKRYGEEMEKDLREALLNDSFLEAIEEHELKVLGRPEFDNVHFEKGDPFSYDAEIEVHPTFELGTYKGIEVVKAEVSVSDEEIEAELESLRRRHATREPIAVEEAGADDILFGSYRLLDGDTELLRVDDVALTPSSGVVDGLEIPDLAKLFAERGDSKTLRATVTIPEDDWREELRGKEVAVEITLEDAKTLKLPELDDEFAGTLQVESMEKLRELVSETLTRRKTAAEEARIEREILDRLAGELTFDIPEGLFDEQKEARRRRVEFELLQEGRSREEIDAELGKLDETPADEEIRKELRQHFILEKIAEKERIFATEDDVSERVLAYARVYGQSPSEILDELRSSGRLEEFRSEIRQAKARRFLREKAKFVEGKADNTEGAGAAETPAAAATAATDAPDAGAGAGTDSEST